MPFGLSNSPSVFQACMNEIFRDYLDDFVFIYIDDILIASETEEEHLQHIEKVKKSLNDYENTNLKLDRKNVHFSN